MLPATRAGGRVEETFGEDPYLVAQMGMAAVKGFQGDGTFQNKNRVIATLKHFAAHGEPESGINCGPVNVSERLLRDLFLYPFKEAIQKAGAMSVMASYNEIDGVPSHASQWLLQKILREEWGFEGFVVSDYFAITELFFKEGTTHHAVAKNADEASLLAARAGVNIELPDLDSYPSLENLVESGRLDETVIDELVGQMLKYKFQLGLFEDPYVDTETIDIKARHNRERPLALKAAHESIVLMKNAGRQLPLDQNQLKRIAVIGPNAKSTLLGGYSGEPPFYTSVFDGIKAKVRGNVEVLHSEGCKITIDGSWGQDEVILPDSAEDQKAIEEAVRIAETVDLVVLALGGNEQTCREAYAKNHLGDRADLQLFGRQNELVDAIAATGKPIVALLINGRPLAIGESRR